MTERRRSEVSQAALGFHAPETPWQDQPDYWNMSDHDLATAYLDWNAKVNLADEGEQAEAFAFMDDAILQRLGVTVEESSDGMSGINEDARRKIVSFVEQHGVTP